MNCPICGKENPDDVQDCKFCKATLTNPLDPSNPVNVKVSRLAIAALILVFCSLVLTIPAVFAINYPRILNSRTTWVAQTFLFSHILLLISFILGVVSFIKIEKSGGLITGRSFALGAILTSLLIGVIPIWTLFLGRIRGTAYRMVCGTNLASIGKAMMLYANDYEDEFPRADGKTSVWANKIPDWHAKNRSKAYGLNSDGSGGQATISSSLYLLVKYAKVEPKMSICLQDFKVSTFNPAKYGVRDKELIDLWDFGPEPWKHCSYCYHIPYGDYALTTSSDPDLAVAADRNPWIVSPDGQVKDFKRFDPDGNRNDIMAGNSPSHQSDSQNVLFADIHVNQEKTSDCGVIGDNIYTSWDGDDIRRGIPPKLGSQPANKLDSLLVNDPPIKKP